ncbi:AAA ATPase-like protein [Mumia flava]|uniref:AAA ATPase-like protein n=1 Tax=Mumia flava TaxID=1348852 RepID=A0A0B2BRD0_9ACTN|nr:LuxR family transcriptional regulator [Mumia flava]PJJ48196.1 AAA ATPase-like protein [Mumia flava]
MNALVGRVAERERLAAVAASAAEGFGEVLVVRGDPGVGKTALLDDLADGVDGLQVVRLLGVETEAGLAFAGLQRLLLRYRALGSAMPEIQRAALRVALGLEAGPPPDRHLVGLATLTLLAEAGHDRPIVCVVDDVQWLDQESLDALTFVARRIHADRVSMVLAARTSIAVAALAGLPELRLEGLEHAAAHELLSRSVAGDLDPVIAGRIVEATRGVPLAILDLGDELGGDQLSGGATLPDPLPLGGRLESHYLERVGELGTGSRTWLLLAAAEPSGDLARVSAAASALGIDPSDVRAAEETGLVRTRGRVRFRHPLVRSAVYGAADTEDRRRVHDALAAVTTDPVDEDSRAWHLGASRVEPDEHVAGVLARAADRARDRGGYSARVSFLVRAVELTPAGPARIDRTLAAAEAAAIGGAPVQASRLLASLEETELDPVGLGRSLMVRAAVHVYSGLADASADVPAMYLRAARAFEASDPVRAREALVRCASNLGGAEWMMRGCSVEEAATTIREIVGEEPRDVAGTALAALASFALDPYEVAAPQMRAAVDAIASDRVSPTELLELGMLGMVLATGLLDDDARTTILTRSAEVARAAGALYPLDVFLWVRSLTEADIGQLESAGRLLAEVGQVRDAIGLTPDQQEMFKNVEYLAWCGRGPDLEAQIERSGQAAVALGLGGAETMARAASALLASCAGDYETSYRLSAGIVEQNHLQVAQRALVNLVEAAVFTGRDEEARRALVRLESIAAASPTTWARGLAAVGRALVATDDETEVAFREAVQILEPTRNLAALGRARLLYGEWLLRRRRRADARFQLRGALGVFERMGAVRFAERARRELLASGGTEGPGDAAGPTRTSDLTAREATVAAMAAAGSTNAEIAAALLLSPHTVDFHLRKVFRKLGVTSRRELAGTLDAAERIS